MPADIFKLFKKSIEQVQVSTADRGELPQDQPSVAATIDAIVKRRKTLAEAVNESEDNESRITLHIRQSDAQYGVVGNYMNIDGEWHSIVEVRDGKDFSQGKSNFVYIVLGNDIYQPNKEHIWS